MPARCGSPSHMPHEAQTLSRRRPCVEPASGSVVEAWVSFERLSLWKLRSPLRPAPRLARAVLREALHARPPRSGAIHREVVHTEAASPPSTHRAPRTRAPHPRSAIPLCVAPRANAASIAVHNHLTAVVVISPSTALATKNPAKLPRASPASHPFPISPPASFRPALITNPILRIPHFLHIANIPSPISLPHPTSLPPSLTTPFP